MKRFVDLRNQDIPYRFAWWDTVKDQFETHSGEQAWTYFKEFAIDYQGNDLERYRTLAPSWTDTEDIIVTRRETNIRSNSDQIITTTKYENNIPMTERRETFGYNEKGKWVKLTDITQDLQYLKLMRKPGEKQKKDNRGSGR